MPELIVATLGGVTPAPVVWVIKAMDIAVQVYNVQYYRSHNNYCTEKYTIGTS